MSIRRQRKLLNLEYKKFLLVTSQRAWSSNLKFTPHKLNVSL